MFASLVYRRNDGAEARMWSCFPNTHDDKCHLQSLRAKGKPPDPWERFCPGVLGNENVHISWLPRVGGTCTCQRGMCAFWFNRGKGIWGPYSKGQRRTPQVCFSNSRGEVIVCWLVCWRLWGLLSPPQGGSDQSRHLFPVFTCGYSQVRHLGEHGGELGVVWWGFSSFQTHWCCLFQARAWGQVLCPNKSCLSSPPLNWVFHSLNSHLQRRLSPWCTWKGSSSGYPVSAGGTGAMPGALCWTAWSGWPWGQGAQHPGDNEVTLS